MPDDRQEDRRIGFTKSKRGVFLLIMILTAGVAGSAVDLWSKDVNGGFLYPTNNTDWINVTGSKASFLKNASIKFLLINNKKVCLADSTNCPTNFTKKNITGINNLKAITYHGQVSWIYTPISIAGDTACNDLDNLNSNLTYTCQICTDALSGGTIACNSVAAAAENCLCKVD